MAETVFVAGSFFCLTVLGVETAFFCGSAASFRSFNSKLLFSGVDLTVLGPFFFLTFFSFQCDTFFYQIELLKNAQQAL